MQDQDALRPSDVQEELECTPAVVDVEMDRPEIGFELPARLPPSCGRFRSGTRVAGSAD